MFDIRDAEIAHEVARCGGFRAAASKLGLAQSAVSSRISMLESRLGVVLFDRRHKGTRPTPIGRAFLERTARLIAIRDEIASQISGGSEFLGTIRIGVVETVVHTWLDALLRNIRDTMNIRFELAVDTSEAVARKLADDEIDVAIILRHLVPECAQSETVYSCRIAYYAAPSLPLPPEPIGIEELARHPIVTFPKGSLPYAGIERLLTHGATAPPLLHGCASLSTTLHLVEDGFGIGLLPAPMADREIPSGHLRRIETVSDAQLDDLAFALCYLPSQPKAVVDAIRAAVLSAVATMR